MTRPGRGKDARPARQTADVPRSDEKKTQSPTGESEVLFEYAPPVGLQRRLGLAAGFNVHHRALMAISIAWAPLLLLAGAQSLWLHKDVVTPLLDEIGAHTRYLVAVPALVLAEISCAPQLNAIVRNFAESGIVGEADHTRLDEAIGSTLGLLQSKVAEFLVIALSYVVVAAAIYSHPADQVPPWATAGGITPIYSPAGWWHMLVSLPLLLTLLFGWIWRLILWTRLLWRIARLDLRLAISHPDHCAGLAFLGQSVRAFAIVGFALAAIVAGRSATVVLNGGGLPTPQLYFNIGLMTGIAALFVAPLLVFSPTLIKTWRRAIFDYGGLAERMGQVFERKWLAVRKSDDQVLEKPDFSATADLYQVVSNAYAIRFVPLGLKDLAMLVIAMLLPFLPVVLMAVPADVIWTQIRNLLF